MKAGVRILVGEVADDDWGSTMLVYGDVECLGLHEEEEQS